MRVRVPSLAQHRRVEYRQLGWAHNPEDVGSNPSSATMRNRIKKRRWFIKRGDKYYGRSHFCLRGWPGHFCAVSEMVESNGVAVFSDLKSAAIFLNIPTNG